MKTTTEMQLVPVTKLVPYVNNARTIELDEKFCDVIVRRYIEQVGTDEKVGVLRNGKEYKYREVAPHDE